MVQKNNKLLYENNIRHDSNFIPIPKIGFIYGLNLATTNIDMLVFSSVSFSHF